MNIKSLRKNYDKLSKRERFILFDAAENRDDKSEMDAILLATPNEDWIKPDIALQAEQLLKVRLLILVQRLKYCREAMFWLSLSIKEEIIDNCKKKDRVFYDYARLNAYFYSVTIDTSYSIYEEIGLDIDAWKAKESELFGFDFVEEMTDLQMRVIAFDEKEAEAFINKIGKKKGFEKIELGFTYDNQIDQTRKTLKKQGFEEFFKD